MSVSLNWLRTPRSGCCSPAPAGVRTPKLNFCNSIRSCVGCSQGWSSIGRWQPWPFSFVWRPVWACISWAVAEQLSSQQCVRKLCFLCFWANGLLMGGWHWQVHFNWWPYWTRASAGWSLFWFLASAKLGVKRRDLINGHRVIAIQLELVLDSEHSFSTNWRFWFGT